MGLEGKGTAACEPADRARVGGLCWRDEAFSFRDQGRDRTIQVRLMVKPCLENIRSACDLILAGPAGCLPPSSPFLRGDRPLSF